MAMRATLLPALRLAAPRTSPAPARAARLHTSALRAVHASPAVALRATAPAADAAAPVLIGAAVLGAGVAARFLFKGSPSTPSGKWAKGGFQAKMDKKEASQILGLREASLTKAKIKDAHRRMMIANHPDRGGSPYLASSACIPAACMPDHQLTPPPLVPLPQKSTRPRTCSKRTPLGSRIPQPQPLFTLLSTAMHDSNRWSTGA